MKFLKILKYLVITWLSVTILLGVGGIIKYNYDLNTYIDQEVDSRYKVTKPAPQQTEVYVVGTVHYETDEIKRDDLYNYISDISPSLILYESDSKTVKQMLRRTDFMRQLMSAYQKENKVESFVCHRYLENHPNCTLQPYEWEERDAYHQKHQLAKKSNRLINTAVHLYQNSLLSNEESELIKAYLASNKSYNGLSRSKSLVDINNSRTDSIIRTRQAYVYDTVPKILVGRQDTKELQDIVPIHLAYWDTRNQAMVANILEQVKINPNKRIVVLTGYSHRYYLLDALKQHESEFNFSIKD